ncbi:PilW family protein [Pseudomonas gingeri]|uniref:Prepilin-type N-terminal cleavage/methylation domain-containing protein n=1 Tax=Pseudomonas gingeri TaxID=117681 RepID=A0A7Y7WQ98_9PSED|nr:prepilin-type N-terminal cleavage/methylation domain-containing protein [Pseudomonas gingeri]NWB85734.1 prepilin-type N-terminal cleavage/methylation domain-containing protein [Pseudomonas gingeri]
MRQKGFSLIEAMLAMVIGLIMSLAATSLAISYDAGRMSNIASNTANSNGTTAAETINTALEMAGAGLISNYGQICTHLYSTTATNTNSGIELDMIKLDVTTDPNSNHVIFAYGSGGSAASLLKVSVSLANPNDDIGVPLVGSVATGDDILLAYSSAGSGADCTLRRATAPNAVNGSAGMVNIGLSATAEYNQAIAGVPTYAADFYIVPEQVFNYQEWYSESAMLKFKNKITGKVSIVADGVVFLRAQYGVNSGLGLTWQDQLPSQLNSLKAIRTGIVVRSGNREKQANAANCTSTTNATINFDSWQNAANGSGSVDVSALTNTDSTVLIPDWRCYFYKTYTTVTPLRSLAWATAQ